VSCWEAVDTDTPLPALNLDRIGHFPLLTDNPPAAPATIWTSPTMPQMLAHEQFPKRLGSGYSKLPQIAHRPASADSPADHHKICSTFLKVLPIVLLQIFSWVF